MPALRNTKHELFALRIAAGEKQAQAYCDIYNKASASACRSQAHLLVNHPDIIDRVDELKREANARPTAKYFLTREEKRMGLADMFRVDVASFIDDQGRVDLKKVRKLPAWCIKRLKIHEVTREKDGETITTRTFDLEVADRLEALKIDNSLEEKNPDVTEVIEEVPQTEAEKKRKLAADRARDVIKRLSHHGDKVIDV